MLTCGIEIKGSDAILCLLSKQDGLFQIADCRQTRVSLVKSELSENLKSFQFTLKKLFEDYKVDEVVIRERPTKGKFAGGSVGFKMESAIQLIDTVNVKLLNNAEIKSRIKYTPMPVPFAATGLKAFQEGAFNTAYASLCPEAPKE
ncbi:DUF3010 family protein [Marinomonas sp. PE14-40]|uniref:DUF3010 family protein n=1 Tax=Marinomonas sp. PE14-40 TaxID=3060621 RepID=UPI003F664CA1